MQPHRHILAPRNSAQTINFHSFLVLRFHRKKTCYHIITLFFLFYWTYLAEINSIFRPHSQQQYSNVLFLKRQNCLLVSEPRFYAMRCSTHSLLCINHTKLSWKNRLDQEYYYCKHLFIHYLWSLQNILAATCSLKAILDSCYNLQTKF